ncbi:D-alanyl-D-alanine carboxypeptidase family protein [Methylobrevis pamukkalensis]|uniref:D-alanyl-D-alanine carboxypeptidase n=1 Tax=Methylobrevis pamukkalensis TaxID=1439726 RepID=A0A1E3GZT6_9HYPH|nr:D-alanyl-D-alanine carboxypeptidase family protein [Methylobrevis pamukkalensis]ODN68841.1 D-alanyl-D-alanine carboxypeptidase [Methylobrevis pamukkalensis]
MARSERDELIVALEARVSGFEREMSKATKTADRRYKELTAGSSRAAKRMETDFAGSATRINSTLAGLGTRMKTAGAGMPAAFAGGLLGGIGVGALSELPRVFADITRGLANMKAEAARAGLGVEEFQALEYAASKSKVSIDAIVDGMKELQLRADEYIVTGSGSASEAFQRLGFTADQLKDRLKDPSALLLEIVERVRDLDKAAQIRVFDELFGGTGGEQFLQMIGQGSEGIRDLMNEARSAGLIIQSDIIDKAAEIDAKFEQLSRTIGVTFKSAIVTAADAMGDLMALMPDWSTGQGPMTKAGDLAGRLAGSAITGRGDLPEGGAAGARDLLRQRLGQGFDPGFFYRDDVIHKMGASFGPGSRMSTTDATALLQKQLAGGRSASAVTGMKSDFANSLALMIASAPEAVRSATSISSGFRSFQKQAELWDAAVKKYGSEDAARKWVAPPGKSMHNAGNAADLAFGTDDARKWFHENAGSYGLSFPMAHELGTLRMPARGHRRTTRISGSSTKPGRNRPATMMR